MLSAGDIMMNKTQKTLLSLHTDSSEGDHHKYELQIVVSAMTQKYKFLWEYTGQRLRFWGEGC